MKHKFFLSLTFGSIITTTSFSSACVLNINKNTYNENNNAKDNNLNEEINLKKQNNNNNNSAHDKSNNLNIFDLKSDILLYDFSDELAPNKATRVSLDFIKDGDTFRFKHKNVLYNVRFSGVDTPEKMHKTDNDDWEKTTGKQYEYGMLATKFTTSVLTIVGGEIYIIPQPTKGGKTNISDHYGRIVGIVYVKYNNNWYNLNSEIVLLGYGRKHYISSSKSSKYYNPNSAYIAQLNSSEEFARKNRLGIYSVDGALEEIYPR
ncbi:thermonuclease family protein [Mycoplasma zalophidermidis]|uniref:thermonuclease family protein n=1 Tax=Mycoplasma zalophidermidis TaxID=398174 RepID=UPI00215C55E9|nr:thermonuclease family protein [Mycoplasma zalophidermidis]MCR8966584.1 thermonuclease family protein [Mycoplasma zalophidermidis]